jgi:hypothetical protein
MALGRGAGADASDAVAATEIGTKSVILSAAKRRSARRQSQSWFG